MVFSQLVQLSILWKRWRDRKHQWDENSIFGISPFNGNIWWFFRALNYWFLGHQSVTRYQYTQIVMTFVIRQLKKNCEAVSWHPGKFHNSIQTTMNVVFTQMTCCANFLECEMWHKQFPSLTAASPRVILSQSDVRDVIPVTMAWHQWHHASWGAIRSQAWQHPDNSAGINGEIIGQANGSLEGAVWWSILAGLPRQIKWKLSSLWNIVITEWVACYLCFVCCGWLVCFWWDFLVA